MDHTANKEMILEKLNILKFPVKNITFIILVNKRGEILGI
jgi:hypothetical protein